MLYLHYNNSFSKEQNINMEATMQFITKYLSLATLLLTFSFASHAENNVKAELISESAAVVAGKNLQLSVVLDAKEGWHTYYKDAGDAGLPTELKWTLPDGFSAGEIDWPTPLKMTEGTLNINAYIGKTTLPVTITTPQKLAEKTYNFKVKALWLACKDICIPEEQDLSIELPVSSTSSLLGETEAIQKNVDVKAGLLRNARNDNMDSSLFIILALAFLGGLVLNIMPCVLPVLSMKALALVRKSGKSSAHTIPHGVAYTLGIMLSFAMIAGLLIMLQQGGEAIGWGYQMQSPAFVGFLIYLLFLVGLSLSGAFHLPVLLGGVGGNLASEASIRGSFFTGILATMVATPCTAPFMASAVGASLTLPAWAAMLVFLAIGFGLAFPFLLISIFPSCLKFLPKSGAWTERFKEFLAFPMYASVIWLLWVLGLQVGIGGVGLVLTGLLFIVFILWLKRGKLFSFLLALAVIIATLFNVSSDEKMPEVAYSKQALAELRSQGKAVFVDATAAWCITCQINKQVALNTTKTKDAFAKNGVVLMVADWTKKNPEITELLHGFGYNGVPLNVFYPANNGEPIVLPQILSEDMVIEVISTPKIQPNP